jgi:pentatricopeptide repeat protein
MQQLTKEERPNVISYNTVIHAYSNDFQTALGLAEEMVDRGIIPNDSTCHTLLKILAKDDRVTNKEEQKAEMQQRFHFRQHRRRRQKSKTAKS